ncbi:hypothetical protein SAMN05428642_1202 [Flaviramulus basaltis]|uniref:CarboxypepD_reg-like domain-containing protein n=1 Tax=Flaviramulus basaltis TaxID=369401 RepID=A0A1K2ISA8_9FLAO|nr:hypothetical protein [Flaviramulus basaltis]SFZ95255.1 hypothetical protein SAMN05428642_1202 [Flaviramulus basaltis]
MVIQIQKGKNAINKSLLILATLYFSNLYSQNILKGTFCTDYEMKDFSDCLIFREDKTFEFNHSGDTGTLEYGEGEYKFIGNKLILNYNKTSAKKLGYYKLSIWDNNCDSINLIVNVFNRRTKEPIKYANVFFKDNTNKMGYNGASANENGMVKLVINKEKNIIELNVVYLGFLEQKINLMRNKNYMIEVYLKEVSDEAGIPILNQIDSFEIVKKKPKYFTVQNKEGKIVTWKKRDD